MKTFDCVTMKDEIQQALLSEWRGMHDSEVIAKVRSDLDRLSGPLGDLCRRLHAGALDTPQGKKPAHA
jgi:hypothetical protein